MDKKSVNPLRRSKRIAGISPSFQNNTAKKQKSKIENREDLNEQKCHQELQKNTSELTASTSKMSIDSSKSTTSDLHKKEEDKRDKNQNKNKIKSAVSNALNSVLNKFKSAVSSNSQQKQEKNERHKVQQNDYLKKMTKDKHEEHKLKQNEHKKNYVKELSTIQKAQFDLNHNKSQKMHLQNMNPDKFEESKSKQNEHKKMYVKQLSTDQKAQFDSDHAKSQQKSYSNLPKEKKKQIVDANKARITKAQTRKIEELKKEAVHFDEKTLKSHSCGSFNVICKYCSAKHFPTEKSDHGSFKDCCQNGRIKLPKELDIDGNPLNYPKEFESLLSNLQNKDRENFLEFIRSYNNAVAFASLGADIVHFSGRGPNVFKVHGQTYHKTSHLIPPDNQVPQFAQLYVIDSSYANKIRLQHPANQGLKEHILNKIVEFLNAHNRLAQSYHLNHEIEKRETNRAIQNGEEIPIVSMVLKNDRQTDRRRYNLPTSNEVAMIFVNGDGEPPYNRDIHIYPKNPENPDKPYINIKITNPNLDPMTYPILFPYGEPGWQTNWECEHYPGAVLNRIRNNVSMRQYKNALTAIRKDQFNAIMHAGKLTQQWCVDSYLQVEANELHYIKTHQSSLRREQYNGLFDHVQHLADKNNMPAGISIILPSTFEGSPRNMHQHYCDAMAIFATRGHPDYFITFTANPEWLEIVENLEPGEKPVDRPDLVARVFKIKLDAFMDEIVKNQIFGKVNAYVYTIEFQKRGLPHAHILITVDGANKLTTPEKINQNISAEIPSDSNPKLKSLVLKLMMHGPCGEGFPNSPCMIDGKCSKHFPRDLSESTVINEKGYPTYRRREIEPILVRHKLMDNRSVVPYNPYLLLKYQAHINVEAVSSAIFVKYIYKYLYKSYDCARVYISSEGQQQMGIDEIANFIDCRYVSAPEAIWRLKGFKMHDHSHAVIRLSVHLEHEQSVTFHDGQEIDALERADNKNTTLMAFFELNRTDPEARQYLYTEIPKHYKFDKTKGTWIKRKKGEDHIVTRMFTVNIKDEERFYMRMLLLHVRGATSFENLRSFNGKIFETYKKAAMERGLLASDEEWDNCLKEATLYYMPKQLRECFAYICVFNQPAEPLKLWQKYKNEMSSGYYFLEDGDSKPNPENSALHDINNIFIQHRLSCAHFGLPMPQGDRPQEKTFNEQEEAFFAEQNIFKLNDAQFSAFSRVIAAVENETEKQKLFYLDGPGGSGKTFLYETLIHFFRGKGLNVESFATTGIAATLLKGGRTVHSGFGLPVPLNETSVSLIRPSSKEADVLRKASLIIIDEISMLSKHGLRCIDKILGEIMNCNKPFGGKTLIVGGDFRQTLPVVPGGNRTQIIESCVKSSPLWKHFEKLTLSANMRSRDQEEHNKWLLAVGSGTLEPVDGIFEENTILIPEKLISTSDDLIEVIFKDIDKINGEFFANRVILAPTNEETLNLNRKIIEKIPEKAEIYYSADEIITEDPNDYNNYSIEFINMQTPSGMPPHVLMIKKGIIIILLRNINPKRGLCNGTRLE